MPFAAALRARPHTVGRFRLAAWGRYREAKELALAAIQQNDPALRHGAIYLFGYVAEMVLKAAYFRLCPTADPSGEIGVSDMHAARTRATNHFGVLWPGTNLHYLPGWVHLLTLERQAAGRPYPQQFAIAVQSNTSDIALLWQEVIRYYDSSPSLAEIGAAHASARWLITQFPLL